MSSQPSGTKAILEFDSPTWLGPGSLPRRRVAVCAVSFRSALCDVNKADNTSPNQHALHPTASLLFPCAGATGASDKASHFTPFAIGNLDKDTAHSHRISRRQLPRGTRETYTTSPATRETRAHALAAPQLPTHKTWSTPTRTSTGVSA